MATGSTRDQVHRGWFISANRKMLEGKKKRKRIRKRKPWSPLPSEQCHLLSSSTNAIKPTESRLCAQQFPEQFSEPRIQYDIIFGSIKPLRSIFPYVVGGESVMKNKKKQGGIGLYILVPS